MAVTDAYEQPLSVEVCEGEIVLRAVNGPFGISLTPAAAEKTAADLAAAARAAQRQASQDAGDRD